MTITLSMPRRGPKKKKISISIDEELYIQIQDKKSENDTTSSFINTILRAVIFNKSIKM